MGALRVYTIAPNLFSNILCPNANVSKERTDSIFTALSTRQYNIPEDRNLQLVDLVAK
jgi:hypothetical protein